MWCGSSLNKVLAVPRLNLMMPAEKIVQQLRAWEPSTPFLLLPVHQAGVTSISEGISESPQPTSDKIAR